MRGTLASRIAGIAAAVALATFSIIISKTLGHTLNSEGFVTLSPVLCAIVIGVFWRNVIGVAATWSPGLQFVTHSLLRVGIALVGLRLTLAGIGDSVLLAVPVVVGCIATAIVTSLVVGRALGVSDPLRMLLAAGTAICGCTAVVATTPITRAQPSETGIALTCVVIMGCVGMIAYPWLAHVFFAQRPDAAAVFLATSIHDTSQVLAAALIYTQQFGFDEVAPIAAFTKLLRNLSLLLVLPLFAVLAGRRAAPEKSATNVRVLPAFLIWFVALAALRLLGDSSVGETHPQVWSSALSVVFMVSEALLVCGMVAVGLSVSFADLRGVGLAAVTTALAVAIAVGLCSLVLTGLMLRVI